MKTHGEPSPYYIKSPFLDKSVFEKLCAIEGIFFDENEKAKMTTLDNSEMSSEEKVKLILQELQTK